MDWSYVAGSLMGMAALATGFLAGKWVYQTEDAVVEVEEEPYLSEDEVRELIAEQVMDEQEEYPCDTEVVCGEECSTCEGYWSAEKHEEYWTKIADTCDFRRWALDALADLDEMEEADRG